MLWPRTLKAPPPFRLPTRLPQACTTVPATHFNCSTEAPNHRTSRNQKTSGGPFFCLESPDSSKAPGRLKRKGIGACRGGLRFCICSHSLFTIYLVASCPHRTDFGVRAACGGAGPWHRVVLPFNKPSISAVTFGRQLCFFYSDNDWFHWLRIYEHPNLLIADRFENSQIFEITYEARNPVQTVVML